MISRAVRTVGAPVRALEIALIRMYRATLSGWLGGQCRYYPTCSHYAEDAIRQHGVMKGTTLAAWRILRCNPFGKGGIDHVRSVVSYDAVTRRPDRVAP
jgi:putative membrane protein insertion efficiency factor